MFLQVRLYYDWFLVPGSCKCWRPDYFSRYVRRKNGGAELWTNPWPGLVLVVLKQNNVFNRLILLSQLYIIYLQNINIWLVWTLYNGHKSLSYIQPSIIFLNWFWWNSETNTNMSWFSRFLPPKLPLP